MNGTTFSPFNAATGFVLSGRDTGNQFVFVRETCSTSVNQNCIKFRHDRVQLLGAFSGDKWYMYDTQSKEKRKKNALQKKKRNRRKMMMEMMVFLFYHDAESNYLQRSRVVPGCTCSSFHT